MPTKKEILKDITHLKRLVSALDFPTSTPNDHIRMAAEARLEALREKVQKYNTPKDE